MICWNSKNDKISTSSYSTKNNVHKILNESKIIFIYT